MKVRKPVVQRSNEVIGAASTTGPTRQRDGQCLRKGERRMLLPLVPKFTQTTARASTA